MYNFRDLIDLAFDEDSVHLKVLQTVLKIVISQLNLDNIKIELEGSNFKKNPRQMTDTLEITESINEDHKILFVKNSLNVPDKPYKFDPVHKSISINEQPTECHKAANQVVDMIQLLNVTKRVEALEITAHKISSMIDSLLKLNNPSNDMKQSSKTFNCTKKLQTPRGTLGSKKGDKLQEFPCISSFAPCPMIELMVSETKSNSLKSSAIQEFECEIKNQIDSVNKVVSENFFYLQHQMCNMQKQFGVVEEEINDLMYACEINDQKLEETMTEIVDFNSNIFCLKSDVKTLLKEQSDLQSKIEIMQQQIAILELNKAEKVVVERELDLKATVIELEKMLPKREFTPLWEDVNRRIEENKLHHERHEETIKIILKQFRTELCDKLEKDEVEKFKNLVLSLFDNFVSNLRNLLLVLKKDATGIAGIKSTTGSLGCLVCQSKMLMNQTTETIPRLDSIATKFKVDVYKYPVTHARNLRRFCGGENTITKSTEKVMVKGKLLTEQEPNFLNFPNSQPCFIISTDNSIYRADPLKCLQNSR
ncbi:unnamed protein product [Diamesa serratosioi]